MGCRNSKDVSDVFKNDKPIRDIFIEESGLGVQGDVSFWLVWACWHHGETKFGVAFICLEAFLQTAFVFYVLVIHRDQSLLDRYNLREC